MPRRKVQQCVTDFRLLWPLFGLGVVIGSGVIALAFVPFHLEWWVVTLVWLVVVTVFAVVGAQTSYHVGWRVTRYTSQRQPGNAQKSASGPRRKADESSRATMKAAYIGAVAVVIGAIIPLIALFWPRKPPPVITIESVSFQDSSAVEMVTVNGTEQRLGIGQLIFVVATLGRSAWVVGGPAYVTPGGTWTAQLEVSPPYSGNLTVIAGLTPGCGTTICEISQAYISQAKARLQSIGPNGFVVTSSGLVVLPPPPINSEQATDALLTGDQIESIIKARTIRPVSSVNSVPILDLSSSKTQFIGSCPVTPNSLLPVAHSLVKTGTFNVPTLGMVEIGEQVVAYRSGDGLQALDAAAAALQRCGFTPIQGISPAEIMGFTKGSLKEYGLEIENQGDVLIEVGISRINKLEPRTQNDLKIVLNRLISSISTKVDELVLLPSVPIPSVVGQTPSKAPTASASPISDSVSGP